MEKCSTLGVVDLHGFEKFVQPQTNGFDQLLANYADEKIHNLSVPHLALTEQALYAKEKVSKNDEFCITNKELCI